MSKELTNEEILKNVYKYQSKAELTQEEIDTIIEMFDKPEKFVILRKMLQVLTDEERDIQVPSKEAMIGSNPSELAEYGLQVAVRSMVEELQRKTLLQFYHRVKTFHVTEKEQELAKEELETKIEEDNKEEKKDQHETAKRRVGTNV